MENKSIIEATENAGWAIAPDEDFGPTNDRRGKRRNFATVLSRIR